MSDFLANKEVNNHNTPNVGFDLHENLNAEVLSQMLSTGTNRGGANFSEIISKSHPDLIGYEKLKKQERFEKVSEYIHLYYKDHSEELSQSVKDIGEAWKEYSPQFFAETKKLFPHTEWPNGKYVGHLSVSPPYPRFLETKTFLVAYKPINSAIRIATHEMLHFIFFEYARQRYLPQIENTIQREMEEKLNGKFKIPLWELSEIFNLMVLSEKEWGIGQANVSASSHSKLREILPEINKTWDKSDRNVDKFFTNIEK